MSEKKEPFLKNQNKSDVDSWGTSRRLAVVISAVLGCLTNAGLAFGFSALLPVLIWQGAFRDSCGADEPIHAEGTCRTQSLALTGMFAIATSLLNVMALPCGFMLDSAGPRVTASFAAGAVGVGCAMFAFGGPGWWGHFFYYSGFMLLAIAGPAVFNCTLSFGNLFPGREGLVTASLVGCFDASSAVFVAVAYIIESGVLPFRDAFVGYAMIPLLTAVFAAALWPKKPVGAKVLSCSGEIEQVHLAPLEGRSLQGQLCSKEFVLLAWTMAVTMVVINFFIATCLPQMTAVSSEVNSETAGHLTKTFSKMLPLGGIIFIPAIGKIIDSCGPNTGYIVLWFCLVLFNISLAMYNATGQEVFAYSAFAVFSFCRPLFYTVGASFVGATFGFVNFGKVYGFVTMIAGFGNFAVAPISALAASKGFYEANVLLSVLQVSTLGLPVYVLLKSRNRRRVSSGMGPRASFATPYSDLGRRVSTYSG